MNDLQLALIAAGAAAVALVWGYNKWQERAHRKLAEKVFRGDQPDALLAGQEEAPPEPVSHPEPVAEMVRREPVIDAPIVPAPAPGPADDDETAADDAGRALPPLPAQWSDEVADCTVRIDFVEPLPAPALWAAKAPWAGQIGKNLSWLGFDERSEEWKLLSAHDAGRYGVVCAALQLADRQGAVSDAELSIFLDGVRALAHQFSGLAEVPTRDRVLMHARALDEFCAGVDVQLGVNVVEAAGGAFAGTKLRGLAEAMGLVLRGDGAFHSVDDAGNTLFTLSNTGAELFETEAMRSLATHGVTLTMDVPRVAAGRTVFERLLTTARQLTQGLGGVLVDGQRNPLSADMIGGIGAKIVEVQEKMAAHQIPAGGTRAQRLFS